MPSVSTEMVELFLYATLNESATFSNPATDRFIRRKMS